MSPVNKDLLERAMDLARDMSLLAEEGEVQCGDDGCAVLCGVIRDCAYRIKGRAEREKEVHIMLGRTASS